MISLDAQEAVAVVAQIDNALNVNQVAAVGGVIFGHTSTATATFESVTALTAIAVVSTVVTSAITKVTGLTLGTRLIVLTGALLACSGGSGCRRLGLFALGVRVVFSHDVFKVQVRRRSGTTRAHRTAGLGGLGALDCFNQAGLARP